ncbi:MAG: hypothetical protein ACLFQB_10365 [Chitinispirillaceae bacterium]
MTPSPQLPLSERLRRLEKENACLRKKVRAYEGLETKHNDYLASITEKEAFNFALFQYTPVLLVVVDREGKVVKSNKAKQNSGDRLPKIGDRMYIDYAAHHKVNMRKELMECMEHGVGQVFPETKYGAKYLSVSISPFPQGALIATQDITDRVVAEEDRKKLIQELRRALDEVEALRGLLPICANCKKIRDDQGYWNHIELYISKRTKADFTHTLCPKCISEYYPDFYKDGK